LAEALDRLNRFEIDAAEANRGPKASVSDDSLNPDEAPTAVHESVRELTPSSPKVTRRSKSRPASKVKPATSKPDAISVTEEDRVGAYQAQAQAQAPKAQRSSRGFLWFALILGASAYIYSDTKAQTIVLSHWINVQVQIERHLGLDLSRGAELLEKYFPSFELLRSGSQDTPRQPEVGVVLELAERPSSKPLLAVSSMREINALLPKLDEDIGVSKDLVIAYQALLSDNPEHELALAGIENLKSYHIQKLERSLEAGHLPIAQALMDSALANLPEIDLSVRLQILQKQLHLMQLGLAIEQAQLDEAGALLGEAQSLYPDSEELHNLELQYREAVRVNKGATALMR